MSSDRQLREFADALALLLEGNEEMASVLKYDLHAIQQGRETLGSYDMLTWAQLDALLCELTPEQLTELIGPPTTSGDL